MAEHSNLQLDQVLSATRGAVRLRNQRRRTKHVRDPKRKLTKFERRYSELGKELIVEKKRVDYVLIHEHKPVTDHDDVKKCEELKRHDNQRKLFERACKLEGLKIQKDTINERAFTKLHTPFKRLCVEAERVKLEMPLKGCEIYEAAPTGYFAKFIEDHFETDDEVDFVSAPFLMEHIHLYENFADPTNFFRPALRSLLTHNILINIDIRKLALYGTKKDTLNNHATFSGASDMETDQGTDEDNITSAQEDFFEFLPRSIVECELYETEGPRVGLPYLQMKGIYTDSFVLHDDSVEDPIDIVKWMQENENKGYKKMDDKIPLETSKSNSMKAVGTLQSTRSELTGIESQNDTRQDLDNTWAQFTKFQPLWKIRNYFGEKIAFYFAWSGAFIMSLWIPTLFGLIIFFYGIALSVEKQAEIDSIAVTTTLAPNSTITAGSVIDGVKQAVDVTLTVLQASLDNAVTPYFALVICLWGTIFLEMWKRTTATLAYEWDVDNYEAHEPDRPQFYGTMNRSDPVTKELNWFYPIKKQVFKFTTSGFMLLFMVFLVFVSVLGVIVYRVIISVDYCPTLSAASCMFLTSVISSVFNAGSILLLGKLYDLLAVKLTDWENHRTQTAYEDALIIKLFGFQFANSYASCFYIAFFRGRFGANGVIGLGTAYADSCAADSCMPELSIQVLVLMLVKPFPKLLKDIVIPFVKKRWHKRPSWCLRCLGKKKNKIDEETGAASPAHNPLQEFLEHERLKPSLEDFTLGEYTEKFIQYGYLMLFAASFPLAPLLALLTNLIDIRVDAKRMLWWYRRPVAFISQDIGMWYNILTFVNICGVVSNGFLIAFTSSWGNSFDTAGKLWVVIGFEHLVFAVRFIMEYIIPDVPGPIRLAMRREKYQVAVKLNSVRQAETDFGNLIPASVALPTKLKPLQDERDRAVSHRPFTAESKVPDHQIIGLNDSYGLVSVSGVHTTEVIPEETEQDMGKVMSVEAYSNVQSELEQQD